MRIFRNIVLLGLIGLVTACSSYAHHDMASAEYERLYLSFSQQSQKENPDGWANWSDL